jgi:hypothetical protein
VIVVGYDTTPPGRSGLIAMLERVSAAVNAQSLSVPKSGHSFVTPVAERAKLLRRPNSAAHKSSFFAGWAMMLSSRNQVSRITVRGGAGPT